jgi:redox-sensitive bicupin YhaK (pirin superfamily)
VRSWDIRSLELQAHAPQILSSTDDARAIALQIPQGEALDEHQVHERAWVVVLDGEVQIATSDGEQVTGGAGLLAEFHPAERHTVSARSDARILLLLTPWPAPDHPGAMSLEDKANARESAAQRRSA